MSDEHMARNPLNWNRETICHDSFPIFRQMTKSDKTQIYNCSSPNILICLKKVLETDTSVSNSAVSSV